MMSPPTAALAVFSEIVQFVSRIEYQDSASAHIPPPNLDAVLQVTVHPLIVTDE